MVTLAFHTKEGECVSVETEEEIGVYMFEPIGVAISAPGGFLGKIPEDWLFTGAQTDDGGNNLKFSRLAFPDGNNGGISLNSPFPVVKLSSDGTPVNGEKTSEINAAMRAGMTLFENRFDTFA